MPKKKTKVKSILSRLPVKKTTTKSKESKKDTEIKKILKKHQQEGSEKFKIEKAKLGLTKTTLILLFALIIGGAGGILTNKFLFPYLASLPTFSNMSIFKEFSEQTVVINPTKEVIIEDNKNIIPEAIKKTAPSLVGIFKEEEFISSGIVLTSDGLILTPKVDLDQEETYTIKTQDGSTHKANFVSQEIINQISALKINETDNLPVATLADAKEIEIGDTVISLSFSSENKPHLFSQPDFLGFKKQHNLNEEDRSSLYNNSLNLLGTSESLENAFLVNESGEILGTLITLNEVKYFNNIDNLRNLINNLNRYNRFLYPQLNLGYQIINGKQGENVPHVGGLLVTQVTEDGAADKAGIEEGDIIIQIGAEKILPDQNISELLKPYEPQSKIDLKVIKSQNDQEENIEIILE